MRQLTFEYRNIKHVPQQQPVVTDHFKLHPLNGYPGAARANAQARWSPGGRYHWVVEFHSGGDAPFNGRSGSGEVRGVSPSKEYAFTDMCDVLEAGIGERVKFGQTLFHDELDQYVRLGNEKWQNKATC